MAEQENLVDVAPVSGMKALSQNSTLSDSELSELRDRDTSLDKLRLLRGTSIDALKFLSQSANHRFSVTHPGSIFRQDIPDKSAAPWPSVALIGWFNKAGVRVRTGTAFLFQDDFLLTAGHNLTNDPELIGPRVYFDVDADPSTLDTPFVGGKIDPTLDIGILRLQSSRVGGALSLYLGEVNGLNVTVGGFGVGYPDSDAPRLSMDRGPATSVHDERIEYLVNTAYGDSGAPVLVFKGDDVKVAAIHLRGASIDNASNAGLALSGSVLVAINRLVKAMS